jgi:energy-coupling factor transporter transmembrane protein EcfT
LGSLSVSVYTEVSLGVAVLTVSSQFLTAAIIASWLFRVAARTSSWVGMLAMLIVSLISLILQTIPSMIEMSSRVLDVRSAQVIGPGRGSVQRYWSPSVLDGGGVDSS